MIDLGCKYNLYPDKPILRHTVRGLVAGAATLAAPVAAVGAIALLTVGATIGGPTYGTYRLVKHIRNKRKQRRRLRVINNLTMNNSDENPQRRPNADRDENNDNDDDEEDDDDFNLAIKASLATYQEELAKRDELFDEDFTNLSRDENQKTQQSNGTRF